jgi:hypothetical protein
VSPGSGACTHGTLQQSSSCHKGLGCYRFVPAASATTWRRGLLQKQSAEATSRPSLPGSVAAVEYLDDAPDVHLDDHYAAWLRHHWRCLLPHNLHDRLAGGRMGSARMSVGSQAAFLHWVTGGPEPSLGCPHLLSIAAGLLYANNAGIYIASTNVCAGPCYMFFLSSSNGSDSSSSFIRPLPASLSPEQGGS